jgi:DNA topoisomerase-1
VTLEYALKLLSLPREVGIHPESGKTISAGFGRYGPYLEHEGKYAKIDAEEVLTIGLNRAVTLIAEAKAGGKGRAGGAGGAIKALGEHPDLKQKVEVFSGRYGPYVKCGKVNATLPKDMTPETVTMEDAVTLIAARIAAGAGGKGAKKPRSSSPEGGSAKKPRSSSPKGGSAKKPAAKAKTAAKTETAVANGKSVKAKPAKSAAKPSATKPKAAARKTTTKAASEAT